MSPGDRAPPARRRGDRAIRRAAADVPHSPMPALPRQARYPPPPPRWQVLAVPRQRPDCLAGRHRRSQVLLVGARPPPDGPPQRTHREANTMMAWLEATVALLVAALGAVRWLGSHMRLVWRHRPGRRAAVMATATVIRPLPTARTLAIESPRSQLMPPPVGFHGSAGNGTNAPAPDGGRPLPLDRARSWRDAGTGAVGGLARPTTMPPQRPVFLDLDPLRADGTDPG